MGTFRSQFLGLRLWRLGQLIDLGPSAMNPFATTLVYYFCVRSLSIFVQLPCKSLCAHPTFPPKLMVSALV
jgi:hypothetical protein